MWTRRKKTVAAWSAGNYCTKIIRSLYFAMVIAVVGSTLPKLVAEPVLELMI